ncbi:MAG: tetratricopeptide repeat protein [Deltaproteobacteria bacterium]|nr:tetratricopeptide repeat protein [Deltaproteobacteria bacterium]
MPGTMVAQYRLEAPLGSGGMGVVYRAQDTRLDRAVALKFLPPQLAGNAAAKQRFFIEARAAAALEHPNICTVYEIGQTLRDEVGTEQSFIAMAYYEGETLKQRLERGQLPIPEALDLTLQVARGLMSAHARGVIHRDIKPANLLVTREQVVKILDFGVAKMTDVTLTVGNSRLGTLAYMSPEQARGDVVDARTDIWSLGVVVYEMLTGHRPFRGDVDHATIYAILHEEPPSIRSLRREISERLAEVVHGALVKDPAGRPPSIQAFGRALRSIPVAGFDPASGSFAAASSGDQESGAGASFVATGLGERRQVSVVVTRLARYAELMETLSPTELEPFMSRLWSEVTAVTEGHGGLVNRLSEAAATLVFGIDATREDDLLRAAQAALEIHHRVPTLGDGLPKSIDLTTLLCSGVDTGFVVLRRSEGVGQLYRMAGLAFDTARRLADEADGGEVFLSTDAQRQVSSLFRTEPQPSFAMKGRSRPMMPHRVVGTHQGDRRSEERWDRGEATALVEREAVLAQLDRCLREARRGVGQIITLEGGPGLGKSRLIQEFRRRIDDHDWRLCLGRCSPSTAALAYGPFVEIVRSLLVFDQSAETPVSSASSVADDVVSRVRQIDPDLEEFIPFYLSLLAMPHEAHPIPQHVAKEHLHLAIVEAIAALMVASSRHRLVVLCLEDWHWADASSRDVLRQIGELITTSAFLAIVTYRPDGTVDLGQPEHHTGITLNALSAQGTLAVLRSALGATLFPSDLAERVHDRTGGNPFFIEEVAHKLVEEAAIEVDAGRVVLRHSLEKIELPASVHAVIRARIDRMAPVLRRVLAVASVMERDIGRGVLQEALGEDTDVMTSLDLLRKAGLLQKVRVVPEPAYRFKNLLARDVAYESLLQHQRESIHLRVGNAIETLYKDRLNQHLDELAHHFSRSAEWRRAIHYGRMAVSRAESVYRFAEAHKLVEQVQGWIDKLPEGSERRRLLTEVLLGEERLCETLGLRGRQQQIIDELMLIVDPEGAGGELDALRVEILLRQGDLHTLLRQFGSATSALTQAREIARSLGNAVGERNALRSLGLLSWHQERYDEATTYMEAALTIDRAREDVAAVIGDLSNLGNVLKGKGDLARARDCLEEALAVADAEEKDKARTDLVEKKLNALHMLGAVHRSLGDLEKAAAYFQQGVVLGGESMLPIQRSYHLTSLAHVYLLQGRVDESLRLYEDSVKMCRKTRHATGLSQSLQVFGSILLTLERYEDAIAYLREAAEVFAQLESREDEFSMWAKVADAHEALGQFAPMLEAWRSGLASARLTMDPNRQIQALEGMGRASQRSNQDVAITIGYYAEALALAAEADDAATEVRLRNTMGILEWGRGAFSEALAHYERALALFRMAGDRRHEGLIRNSLGVTLRDLGRLQEAAEQLEQAVAINRETEQGLLEGHGLAALAGVRRQQGELNVAYDLYRQSLALRRRRGDRKGEGWMAYYLARISSEIGETARGRSEISIAIDIADELGDEMLRKVCRELGDLSS